tara:strand:- start:92 stop:301 length:210 start_codon:yes stop_codon:yes gene_type:complete
MDKQTIVRNEQAVDCYGDWHEDSNAECVFDNEYLDGFFADGAISWEEAVETVTAYAKSRSTALIQMTAC